MADGGADKAYLYDAFVSYSHAADHELAPVLQQHMQRFAKPWYRMRSLRVFRDETTLASTPHLWPDIREAMDRSRFFILLAAPLAAKSRWVQQEISHWLTTRGADTLLIVLTEGTIAWNESLNDFDWSSTTALPQAAISKAFKVEPKWEDVAALTNPEDLSMQNPILRKTVASLYSAITGRPLDEVIGDDVRTYRRNRLAAIASIGTILTMIVVGGGYATWSRGERLLAQQTAELAREERERAESRYVAERARFYTERGDTGVAMNMVLEDLEPDADEPKNRPRVPESHLSLFAAINSHLEQRILSGGAETRNVSYSAKGDILAAADRAALIFDASRTTPKLRLLHDGTVQAAEFDKAGDRVLTAARDGKARLWTLSDRKAREFAHTDEVMAARFDSDEKRIATASKDDTAAIWDAATGQRLLQLKHDADVNDLVWSLDGARLFTVTQTGFVRGWDTRTGMLLFEVKHGNQRLGSIRLNRTGTRVATFGRVGAATLVSTQDGSKVASLAHGRSNVWSAAFSPTDDLVATTANDLRTAVWDSEKGIPIYSLLDHSNVVAGATFSADGSRLMTWSPDRTARIYSACDGRELAALLGHVEDVTSAAFSPDGCTVVTGSGDATARTWDLVDRPGQKVLSERRCAPGIPRQRGDRCRSQQVFAEQRHELLDAKFSADGTLVATAGNDRVTRIFDAKTGERRATLPAQTQSILTLDFDKTGRFLITGQGDIVLTARGGVLRVWDWREGRELVQGGIPHTGSVQSVAYSPDGTRILTASGDGLAQIFDATSGALVLKIETPPDPNCGNKPCRLGGATWSPDGKRVATASYGYDACIWDVDGQTGVLTKSTQCVDHTHIVYSANWNSDGSLLLTASGDQTAVIWHARSGEAVRRFYGDSYDFRSAEFFDKDHQIVTVNNDYSIRFWRSDSGRELARVQHRQAHVTSATIDRTGHMLLTSSSDGLARIWQLPETIEDLAALARSSLKRCLHRRQREEFNLVGKPLPEWCAGKLWGGAAERRTPQTQAAVSPGP